MSKRPITPEDLENGIDLDFTEEKERWNSYKLSDGTSFYRLTATFVQAYGETKLG